MPRRMGSPAVARSHQLNDATSAATRQGCALVTTIAAKDGVLAADRKAYLGRGESGHMTKTKIHALADGRLVAVSSAIVGAAHQFLKWLDEGQPGENWPVIEDTERKMDFEAIVLHQDGRIEYYHDSYLPTWLDSDAMAIGSGAPYALGAMEAGASAPGAVGIAARFDNFSGGGVDILRLSDYAPSHEHLSDTR